MNALELRYKIYLGLTDSGIQSPAVELLGPQGDGTVRMRVATSDPRGESRIYTVTIKED